MICENCQEEHDGKYGSGRFCNTKCARGFSTKAKRKDINKNLSKKMKGYRTVPGGLIKLCDYGCGQEAKFEMTSGNWCCKDYFTKCPVNIKKNSMALKQSYKSKKNNRKYYGFPKWAAAKGHVAHVKKLQEYYKTLSFEDKPDPERRRIILREQNEKCLLCGIIDWNGKSLVLHLDHINGDQNYNVRENLRFICPNCHSQTETYCISKGAKKKLLEKNSIPT